MKKYTVILQKKATGEVSVTNHNGDSKEGAEFYWSEGNMACDCNRRIQFELGLGCKKPEESPCTDPIKESEYRVAVISDEGEMLYSEFQPQREE